jgi:hypothetical protein
MKNKNKISLLAKILRNEKAGSIIETGLIIGFSLLCFVLIAGIIMSVIDWSSTALLDFFKFFG